MLLDSRRGGIGGALAATGGGARGAGLALALWNPPRLAKAAARAATDVMNAGSSVGP